MDGGSLRYRYGLMLFLFFLLFAVTATTSFSKSECENIAKSSGPVPQELIELCGDQEPADDAVSVSAVSAQAFGWEASLSTLDSLFLTIPEELTAIGPLVSPTEDFISGCEFDNSGDFSEIYCISSSGEFFTSNTADASRTDIGVAPLFNGESFTGLAMDPTTGIMYACSSNLSASSIFTVDLDTAASTRVGNVTNSPGLIACAFDNFGQMYGYDIITEMLLSINKHTGAGTVVGPIGFNSNFAQGMDFNEVDNTCYMFAFNNDTFRGELRTCNTNDGSTILIGPLGSTTPGGLVQISGAGIAERFTLSPIYPGYQSSINFMNADVATSLGKVFFIWGFAPGSTFIDRPLCNGSRLDIKFPQVVGRMIADIDQFAKLRFYIPLNPAFDKLVYTQALDADTCRVSNLNLNIIRNN